MRTMRDIINEEKETEEKGFEYDGKSEEWIMKETSPVCFFCARLHDDRSRTCDAYPDGIPRPIWMGEYDHKKPYPGDHGLMFKSKTPQEDETVSYISERLKKYEE